MTTIDRQWGGADPTVTERHPGFMTVAVLLCLVVVGGSAGLAAGRVLVLGVHLLLGPPGQEV